jgi:hypothetical protein
MVALTVTQVGGVYRLEGIEDQCGGSAPRRSAVTGLAYLNPDATIGLGLTIVGPGGSPVHVEAIVTPAAVFSGTWSDDFGRTGEFRFTASREEGRQPLPRTAPAQGFVQTVTPANTETICMRLDHPLLENAGDVVLSVTHELTDRGYLNSDFSVWKGHSRWYVCPANIPQMPLGHKFHITIMK